MPHPRGGLAGGVIGDRIYAFGGEGNPDTVTGVFPQSEAFDDQTQTWLELQTMPVPRHGMYGAVVGTKVYIPGGGLQQDAKPITVNGTTTYSNPSNHFDAYCV